MLTYSSVMEMLVITKGHLATTAKRLQVTVKELKTYVDRLDELKMLISILQRVHQASLNPDVVITTLKENNHDLAKTSDKLGTGLAQLREYIAKNPRITEELAMYRKSIADIAETKFFDAVMKDEPWAIKEALHKLRPEIYNPPKEPANKPTIIDVDEHGRIKFQRVGDTDDYPTPDKPPV